MKFCENCGVQVENTATHCPNCGKILDTGKTETQTDLKNQFVQETPVEQTAQYTQPEMQNNPFANANNASYSQPNNPYNQANGTYATQGTYTQPSAQPTAYGPISTQMGEVKANTGLAILSFFIPIAGLIIYFVNKNTKPLTAKKSLKCGIIGFAVSFIVSMIGMLIATLGAGALALGTSAVLDNYSDDSGYYSEYEDVTDYDFDVDTDEFTTEADVTENTNVTTTAPSSTTNVSSNWKNYQISVSGKTITLPCTYQEYVDATGARMKSSDEKSYLDGNYYTIVNVYNSNDDAVGYISIYNNSSTENAYTDCKVVEVSQTSYQVETNNAKPITFPGNITVGMSIDKATLESLFGTPDDTYEYDSEDTDYSSFTYTYCEDSDWTTRQCYEITVTNGEVYDISLNCLN